MEHQEILKEEIAKLDNFPNEEIFIGFKEMHLQLKYNGKEFTLEEEVTHFLSVDKRKIEGLIALRQNVSGFGLNLG